MTRNRVPALPPSLETRRRRSVCSVLPLATSYSVRELHLSLAMFAVPSASRPCGTVVARSTPASWRLRSHVSARLWRSCAGR